MILLQSAFFLNTVGALAGLMAELTQHYVQPLEVLLRGVPVRQTMTEIASKIRSGRIGKIFLHVYNFKFTW